MRATDERIQEMRRAIALALDSKHASPTEAASGCACVLMDIFVELLRVGDPKVSGEMRRMARRLDTLADARPFEAETLATALADSTPRH